MHQVVPSSPSLYAPHPESTERHPPRPRTMPAGIDNPGERRAYILVALKARMERVSVYHSLALAGALHSTHGATSRRLLVVKTHALEAASPKPIEHEKDL